MEPQSPPRRITRARAAAKASETGSSRNSRVTTTATTAASRAKAAAAASTAPVSNKRKTRPDDHEVEPRTRGRLRRQLGEEEKAHSETAQPSESVTRVTRATRGRPKKSPDSAGTDSLSSSSTTTKTTKTSTSTSALAPGRATRARAAARNTVSEALTSRPEPVKAEPSRPNTRSRPKKTTVQEETTQTPAAEPLKKTTRSRTALSAATSTTTSAMPATTTNSRVRKKVTFDAPEKENVDPDATKKSGSNAAPVATGLRARPVRKAPVPRAARGAATRAAGSTSSANPASAPSKGAKTPLSPKKVTQVPYSRDDSEDELTAMDKPPVRSMVKDPLKPPASALSSFRKPDLRRDQPEPPPEESQSQEGDEDDNEGEGEHLRRDALASPARRPPTSPPKDSIRSPAKRAEGLSLPKLPPKNSTAAPTTDAHATPFKASLLSTPARRPQSAIKAFSLNLPSAGRNLSEENASARKASLLKSPAKRPHVPILPRPSPTPEDPAEETSSAAALGQASVVTQSSLEMMGPPETLDAPSDKPSVMTSSEKLMIEEHDEEAMDQLADELHLHLPPTLDFPGRLSAVLPRHADPALRDKPAILGQQPADQPQTPHQEPSSADVIEDPMMMDEPDTLPQTATDPAGPVPGPAPPHSTNPKGGAFGLREKDMDPYHNLDSDPENDDTICRLQINHPPSATPATRKSRRSLAPPRVSAAGFTPLAQKLSAWAASSPTKTAARMSVAAAEVEMTLGVGPSPVKTSSFFEDEMTVRAESEATESLNNNKTAPDQVDGVEDLMGAVQEPEFDDDIMVTEEDIELAAEADEMSLLEPEPSSCQVTPTKSFDDSISDASQEYGDENEMPVDDPALSRGDTRGNVPVPAKTPMRTLHREFHTVSKVPLKPADESTPRPSRRRRAASITRLPAARPTQGLARSATVISYSPTKNDNSTNGDGGHRQRQRQRQRDTSTPTTPTKSEAAWSDMETPARTPRRDLNPSLLGGAVVFVDVHTSEGADASCIFVDLLGQMGARCVESWDWDPDGADGSDKVGITHVVFKDGARRTLEKVREANGVVQCVGVSWVLE